MGMALFQRHAHFFISGAVTAYEQAVCEKITFKKFCEEILRV